MLPLNLVIMCVLLGGWCASRLFGWAKLPPVLGMLMFGLILGSQGELFWPAGLRELEPFLKTFALAVILLRAGLGLKRKVLQKVGRTALQLAILPCLLEASCLFLVLQQFWGFSWQMAGVTAFLLSAVSPAVVVPSMLDLAEKGYGKEKEVPTLVLAGASLDDVLAITLFSLFLGMAIDPGIAWSSALVELPILLILGVIPGLMLGALLIFLFRRNHHSVRATEKTLILLMTALLLIEIGETLQIATLLGVMTLGILLLEYAPPIAAELALNLQKIWIVAEILLFVLIGMQVDLQVAWSAGTATAGLVIMGLLARSAGVWIATARSSLNPQERLFCVCAYLPKATVQAALGAVPLSKGLPHGETILAIAVLSVIITAPLGLFAIRHTGPVLLSRP